VPRFYCREPACDAALAAIGHRRALRQLDRSTYRELLSAALLISTLRRNAIEKRKEHV
jgi:hypothetical protein